MFLQSNDEIVDSVKRFQSLNASILENIGKLDIVKNKPYVANTSMVARMRLDVVNSVAQQLEKNPNKAKKVEKRLIYEINFGKSLSDLVQQAEDELEKLALKVEHDETK